MKNVWKARFGVGAIMVALGVLGLIVTDVKQGVAIWEWVVLAYAALALWLSKWVERQKVSVWQELAHWGGILGVMLAVSHLVTLGTVGDLAAAIFQLMVLSLGVFLAGIYVEPVFLAVGTVLGLFALLSAVLVEYMYVLIVPVAIFGIILSGWISRWSK